MSRHPLTPITVRERNKRKRIINWALFYIAVIGFFGYFIYQQAININTLDFAHGTLQLTTPKTKYTVGDSISYTLKNGLSESISLASTCPAEPLFVYEWTNNAWVRIHDTAKASACNGVPAERTIPAGGSYTQNFDNWPNLFGKPGIYRLVAYASNYTAIPYADFQVVAKPVVIKPQVQVQIQTVIQKVITPVYIQVPSSGGDGGGGGDN